ncbi:MAG: hypothetical protein IJ412_05010 [Oscillospiraceae bacterium]|nr:hypothetical protein [Oscillospiraceae bacterium]
MQENASWLRPKTTRRYLHPPKAERLYTLWAEGKLILGEVERCIDWRSYRRLDCSGLWLVQGESDEALDFHTVQNTVPENGTPIHGLLHSAGALSIGMEAFCSIERRPTCFIRLRLSNTGTAAVHTPLALLLRSGREKELVFGSPDVYASYAPDVNVWKTAPATWRLKAAGGRTVVIDEDAFLTAEGMPVRFDEAAGALRFDAALQPGESAVLTLSFGKGEALPFLYEQEKALTERFWQRELTRLCSLPAAVQNDPKRLHLVQSLTVQTLQCFCHPVDRDWLLPRQGGLQRLIWPWESVAVLEALGRAGDFADYIEPVFDLYFTVLQAPDGEIRPAGENWANITASALYSFARYTMDRSERFYHKYRDHAMAAFEWIRRTRAATPEGEGCFAGLFPPMRACDWAQVFQAWLSTDSVNLLGVTAFAEAAERFGDPRAAEIRREVDDYLAVMRRLVRPYLQQADADGVLRIPMCPDGNDKPLLEGFFPRLNYGRLLELGVIPLQYAGALLRFLKEEGLYRSGLYGHMAFRDGNTHIWYVCGYAEYSWFVSWLKQGDRAAAKEILDSFLQYSITEECYILERFADNDPWFVPWSPNASGNGRLISMLLQYYAD